MANLITVKDCVSQVSMEIGITQQPIADAVGTNDQDIVQLVALLGAVADEVLLNQPYKNLLGDGVWLADSNGNPKRVPTDNADVILFDARLAIDGLKFRFLAAKGLEFAEQMRDFTARLNKLAAAANRKVIDLYADEGPAL